MSATSDLASLEDNCLLRYTYAAGEFIYTKSYKTSWIDLFVFLAPYIVKPTTLDALRSRLKKAIEPTIKTKKGEWVSNLRIDDDEIHTVYFQLKALGLISDVESKSHDIVVKVSKRGERIMMDNWTVKANQDHTEGNEDAE